MASEIVKGRLLVGRNRGKVGRIFFFFQLCAILPLCSCFFFFFLIEDVVFVIVSCSHFFLSTCIYKMFVVILWGFALCMNNFYFLLFVVFLWVWMLTKDCVGFYFLILLWLHFLYMHIEITPVSFAISSGNISSKFCEKFFKECLTGELWVFNAILPFDKNKAFLVQYFKVTFLLPSFSVLNIRRSFCFSVLE